MHFVGAFLLKQKKMQNQKVKPEPIDQETTLTKVVDMITEKPQTIEIDIKPKNKLQAFLIKANLKPSKRVFEIKPQRVINIYRIAGRAVRINAEGLLERMSKDSVGAMMDLLSKHGEDLIYIVATAIQNDHREPTKEMLDIVRNEFEVADLYTVLNVAVSNYNAAAFLNSIALTVGVDALKIKASPNE